MCERPRAGGPVSRSTSKRCGKSAGHRTPAMMNKPPRVMKRFHLRLPHYLRKLMQRSWPFRIAVLASLFLLASPGYSQLPTNLPSAADASRHAERFDDLVREDFFAGDNESLQRGMKVC